MRRIVLFTGLALGPLGIPTIVEVAPGERRRHQCLVPTIAHVLKGTSTIDFAGGSRFEASAGTAFPEAAGTRQNVRILGTAPLKYLVVCVGLEGLPTGDELPRLDYGFRPIFRSRVG